MSILDRSESEAGLTRRGRESVVPGPRQIEGHDAATRVSASILRDQYSHLIERGEAAGQELLAYYRPTGGGRQSEHGVYTEHQEREWWSDVGASLLADLPGTDPPSDPANIGATWGFVGVDPAEYPDDHTRPLADIREDPRNRAHRALDKRGIAQDSDKREAILACVDSLAETGEEDSDSLGSVLYRHSLDLEDVAGTLADLPSIEREERHPPAPEEIEIETYADVLRAERLTNRDVTVMWRFVGR